MGIVPVSRKTHPKCVNNPILRIVMNRYFKKRKELKRKKKNLRRQKELIRQNSKVLSEMENLGGDSNSKIYDFNMKDVINSDLSRKEVRNRYHKKPFKDKDGTLIRFNKDLSLFEKGVPIPYLPRRKGNALKEIKSNLESYGHFNNIERGIPLINGFSENDIPKNYMDFFEQLKNHDYNHLIQLVNYIISECQCYFVSIGVYFGLKKMGIKKEINFTQGLVEVTDDSTGLRSGVVHSWIEDSDGLVYDLSCSSVFYGDDKLSDPLDYQEKYWCISDELFYEKRHVISETVNSYSMDEVFKRFKEEGVLFLDTETLPSGQLDHPIFLDYNGEKFYYPTLEEIESKILEHNNWETIPEKFHWIKLAS